MAIYFESRAKKAFGILRECRFDLMNRLGWVPNSLRGPGQSVILMYHGVVPDQPSRFNWRHVSTSDFECHLLLLRKHCHLLSMADLHAGKVRADRLNVALTFDDGFQNNYLHALPLLEKFQAPASFYVTGANEIGVSHLWPDFLDILSRHAGDKLSVMGLNLVKRGKAYFEENSGESLASIIKHRCPDWNFKLAVFEAFKRWQPNLYRPDYRPFWELMTDEQIREVANSDWVTIGCHGYFHNNLGELPLEDALSELRKSRAYLERITGKQVRELAFPDGSYSPQLVKEAMNQGFEVILGTEHHYGEAARSAAPYRRAGIYSFKPRRAQLLDADGLERKDH
jgi:peptidoglycan/xylan/chitin deacetylase (PgdA/CDA1 family)